MLTVEKVITLASVSIFAEVPDELLVEVASVLEEIEVSAGEEIVHKGDLGTSTYIIVWGKVRVHDGHKELRILGEREVFGELAALDPEPRSASVTALEDTYLFRMEQAALLDLLTQYVGVARGILRVLCQRLRQNNALIRYATLDNTLY
jgi:CRP-like cAMP-binding protein